VIVVGCTSTTRTARQPAYLPEVIDQRSGPLEMAKRIEGDGMRLILGENFLGPSLIDLFHREVALQSPPRAERSRLEVARLEVSVLVTGGRFFVDPSRELVGSGAYRPAPGSLVLDELGPDSRQTARVEIDYRLNGKPMQEVVEGEVVAARVREQTGELYRDAIGRIVSQLERNG
jgi:hypothetical protein